MHCTALAVLLLYALVVRTAVLVRADAVTGALVPNKTTSGAESSAIARGKVATGKFARLNETEERSPPVSPNIMSPAWSSFNSLESMFSRSARSPMFSSTSKPSVRRYFKSLRSQALNSIRARWPQDRDFVVGTFKRFELDTGLEENLFTPKFKRWVAIVDRYNKRNPNDMVSVAEVLAKTYTDLKLVQAFRASPIPRDARRLVTRLEMQLVKYWTKNKKTSLDVFKLLNLHVEGSNIFERPELSLWFLHTALVHVNDRQRTMAKTLLTCYTLEALKTMHQDYIMWDVYNLFDIWASLRTVLALCSPPKKAVNLPGQGKVESQAGGLRKIKENGTV
ncbi:unnamed protein product [Hyaloperonospora brassicae]|uniref:RxLR effector candidate protein n=1 Tax=Hyaloperonospora brassicae TaxID=162125 RepID=A0AAV0THY6_HYABA|nr:unnamed protein product [Hyaloperonospora brassicae]